MATGPADRFPFLDAVDACVCVFDEVGEVLHRSWGHGGIAVDAHHQDQLLEHAARAARTVFDGRRGHRLAGRAGSSGGGSKHDEFVEVAGQRFRLCGSLVDGDAGERKSVAVITIHPDASGWTGLADAGSTLRTAGHRHGLTPREAEVAALVVQHRTNREIATRLSISTHTVRHHVERILSKLGLHSRRQVAAKLRGAEDVR